MPALVRDAVDSVPVMDSRRNTAPAVQAANSPPKEVRFLSGPLLSTASRRPTEREAWSFYWFETHCKGCPQCCDPYAVYKRGERLCPKGDALARDMSLHVYTYDGEIYERLSNPRKTPDRMEILPQYKNLRGQLKAMEKMAKHEQRRSRRPVVQHDQGPGQRVDDRHRDDRYYRERVREEKPKHEKKSEKSRRSDPVQIVNVAPRSTEKDRDEKERSGRRRHSHNADHGREHGRDRVAEKAYVLEERPSRERDHYREGRERDYYREGKDRDHHREDRYTKDRRHNKENDRGYEPLYEVETAGRDKKYRTEIRKPDKEMRRSYYY